MTDRERAIKAEARAQRMEDKTSYALAAASWNSAAMSWKRDQSQESSERVLFAINKVAECDKKASLKYNN